MGISTRSKTGSTRLAAAPAISKPAPSRDPKGKKASRAASTTNKKDASAASSAVKFPDDITLFNDEGARVSTSALLTDDLTGFVLFTYPKANTPGCSTQACALRDAAPELNKSGYAVYGLSYDKPKSQASWRTKHNLSFSLLCDTMNIGVIKKLGAHKAPKGIKRSVFVVKRGDDSKPTIVWSKIGISPKDTVPFVMEYVNKNPSKSDPANEMEKNEEPKATADKEDTAEKNEEEDKKDGEDEKEEKPEEKDVTMAPANGK